MSPVLLHTLLVPFSVLSCCEVSWYSSGVAISQTISSGVPTAYKAAQAALNLLVTIALSSDADVPVRLEGKPITIGPAVAILTELAIFL